MEVVLPAPTHGAWRFLSFHVLPLLQMVWELQCHQLGSALWYLGCLYLLGGFGFVLGGGVGVLVFWVFLT